jgi:hypothetical protein
MSSDLLVAEGVNLSDDDTCAGFALVNANPLLGVLQDNGGAMLTHTLLSNSPAIDAVMDCTDIDGNPITDDQRGGSRPQGANCDLGAVEVILSDCNSDLQVDAGDLSALTLEIFDGDGDDPAQAAGGDFAGSPACDANADNTIDAGDLSCTVLIAFEGSGACGAP